MDTTRNSAGGMDIRQQREMWRDFVRLAAAGAAVVTLALMAIFLL
jgi:hypothetical protein